MAKGVKEYSGTSHDERTVREIVGRVSDDINRSFVTPDEGSYPVFADPDQQLDLGHSDI